MQATGMGNTDNNLVCKGDVMQSENYNSGK